MANSKTLKSFGSGKLTPEEEQAIRRKGNETYRRNCAKRKKLKEELSVLLSMPLENERLKEQIKKLGYDDKNIDNQLALTIALFQEGLKGNVKAYETIRDTVGEKPVERQEVKEITTEWFK